MEQNYYARDVNEPVKLLQLWPCCLQENVMMGKFAKPVAILKVDVEICKR